MIRVFAYSFAALLFGAGVFGIFANGPDWQTSLIELLAFVICAVVSMGALWMMYTAYRCDRNPFAMFVLASMVPFSFVWYYYTRVRGKNLKARRKVHIWFLPDVE